VITPSATQPIETLFRIVGKLNCWATGVLLPNGSASSSIVNRPAPRSRVGMGPALASVGCQSNSLLAPFAFPQPRRGFFLSGRQRGASLIPILALGVDDKAFGHLRDVIAFHPIADRAGITRCAAAARVRTVPWLLRMGLADPAAIVAARAVSHGL
jgi:hypothetical protein